MNPHQKIFYKEGFENCLPCNEDLNLSFCKGWEQTILSRVFVMSDCNSAMPSNAYGFQYPFEGKAYAALNVIQDARRVFNKQGGNKATFRSRGYMCLILAQPLVKNHKYKFSFYITLGEGSAFGVDNLFVDVSGRRLRQDKNDTAVW